VTATITQVGGAKHELTDLRVKGNKFTAECLWLSLPDEYREDALFCTDFLPA
jgi:hypothetical protein